MVDKDSTGGLSVLVNALDLRRGLSSLFMVNKVEGASIYQLKRVQGDFATYVEKSKTGPRIRVIYFPFITAQRGSPPSESTPTPIATATFENTATPTPEATFTPIPEPSVELPPLFIAGPFIKRRDTDEPVVLNGVATEAFSGSPWPVTDAMTYFKSCMLVCGTTIPNRPKFAPHRLPHLK